MKRIGLFVALLVSLCSAAIPVQISPVNDTIVRATCVIFKWTDTYSSCDVIITRDRNSDGFFIPYSEGAWLGSYTPLTINLPLENTKYYWKINAGTLDSFWTSNHPEQLYPIVDLRMDQEIKFIWNKPTTVDTNNQILYVELQVATDSLFQNIVINETNLIDTVYTPTRLQDTTNYYWRVRTINTTTGTSPWSVKKFNRCIPLEPVVKTPTNTQNNIPLTYTCVWNKVLGASSYAVIATTDPDSVAYSPTTQAKQTTDTACTLTNLLPNSTYYWVVVAINDYSYTISDTLTFTTANPDSSPVRYVYSYRAKTSTMQTTIACDLLGRKINMNHTRTLSQNIYLAKQPFMKKLVLK